MADLDLLVWSRSLLMILANWSWSLIFDLQNWRSILYYLKCLTVYWNQIIWCSGGFWCWANNVLKPNFKLNRTNLAKLKFTTFKLPSQHQCMDEIPNGGCKLSCDLIFDLDLWSNRSLPMILIFHEWSWSSPPMILIFDLDQNISDLLQVCFIWAKMVGYTA